MSVTPFRVTFSDHATRRAQQRGIRPVVVDFVLRNADRDLEAGNGCRAYRISKKALAELLSHGAKVGEVELATNVVVILHEDSGEVITVMHDRNKAGNPAAIEAEIAPTSQGERKIDEAVPSGTPPSP